jgi:hypothetical protein
MAKRRQPVPTPIAYVKRWKHAPLFDRGYLPVPQLFLERAAKLNPRLKPAQALLVLNLLSFKWFEDAPFVSYATLGGRLGISAKQAQRQAKELERAGYLRIEEQPGRQNRFHLDGLFDALNGLPVQQGEQADAGQEHGPQAA